MRGQKYFEEEHGIKATKGEMELWLDSLASFYDFFRKVNKHSVIYVSDVERKKC